MKIHPPINHGLKRYSGLQDTAVDWGFTEDTGIDLPQEQNGFAYTPERIAELHEENPAAYPFGDWHTGNTVNMAIGQGDLGVTPMQLANMYAALANGGTLYRPHVGMATLRPVPGTWQEDPGTPCVANDGTVDEGALCTVDPTQVGAVEIPSRWRDPMIAGLLGVAQSSQGGTSGPAFDGFDLAGFPIAGKTGTAQVYGKGDSALYVGFETILCGVRGLRCTCLPNESGLRRGVVDESRLLQHLAALRFVERGRTRHVRVAR